MSLYAMPRTLAGFDPRKKGWRVRSDAGLRPEIHSMGDLELVNIFNPGESSLLGWEILRRSRQVPGENLGLSHLIWILGRAEQIPEEWQKCYLIAPATEWEDQFRTRAMFFMSFNPKHQVWDIGPGWFDNECWEHDGRLLRICSQSISG